MTMMSEKERKEIKRNLEFRSMKIDELRRHQNRRPIHKHHKFQLQYTDPIKFDLWYELEKSDLTRKQRAVMVALTL